ncbi:hypothetical protein FNL39_11914 [Nocardia caishijiensis]|uniref:Uncharacterized protein n=1 Tax=Nocardia caishijiensis TaxID=184756 RepID=A0ABQ6YE76_9NOCA|nr:hypothetical protein FNL39_11914 [Nocardia caishijiensis]
MAWLHLHPRSWYVVKVERLSAKPSMAAIFRATLRCRQCGRERSRVYLWFFLILRLTRMGIHHRAYQDKALALSRQIAADVGRGLDEDAA